MVYIKKVEEYRHINFQHAVHYHTISNKKDE